MPTVVPLGPITGAIGGYLYAIARGKQRGKRLPTVAAGAMLGLGILGLNIYRLQSWARRHPGIMDRVAAERSARIERMIADMQR